MRLLIVCKKHDLPHKKKTKRARQIVELGPPISVHPRAVLRMLFLPLVAPLFRLWQDSFALQVRLDQFCVDSQQLHQPMERGKHLGLIRVNAPALTVQL